MSKPSPGLTVIAVRSIATVFLAVLATATSESIVLAADCSVTDAALLEGDQKITQGRYLEAHTLFAEALSRLERETGRRDQMIPCAMDRLATALIRLGRFQDAVIWSTRAVDRSRTTPPNAVTSVLANNLATHLIERGDLDSAEQWAREAIAIVVQTTHLHHPNHELANLTLAGIHSYRGDYARAEPIFRSALFYLQRSLGESHIEVGLAAASLAEIYRLQNQDDEAIPFYLKAVAAMSNASLTDTWQIVSARSGLMLSLARVGRNAEAEELASSILETLQSANAPNDLRGAFLMQRIALLRLAQKNIPAARHFIERSVAISESVYGAQSPRMIGLLQTYALVLHADKDKQSARRTESRLKAIMKSARQTEP